jgi:hypothetical protein
MGLKRRNPVVFAVGCAVLIEYGAFAWFLFVRIFSRERDLDTLYVSFQWN